jgi:hypothetical protein
MIKLDSGDFALKPNLAGPTNLDRGAKLTYGARGRSVHEANLSEFHGLH